MKSRIAGLFMVLMLVGCAPAQTPETVTETEAPASATEAPADSNEDEALTLVDGAGTTLTFDKAPERIVCLYSRCLELLAALEVEPVGAMVSNEDIITDPYYFPQPNEISILEWDGDFPNLEQVAALEPDLVLGWNELRDPLKDIAPVYTVIDAQDSYQESHEEIRAFAKLLGREETAEQNIEAALDRLAAYKAKSPANLSVMNGFFYNDAFYYRDGASGTCNLFKEVTPCDWSDPTDSASWSVQTSEEGLLDLNPDILIVGAPEFEGKSDAEIFEALKARPLWGELSAIQAGRVYGVSNQVPNMDGMGTVGIERMLDVYMPLFYPDVFPDALTDEQVQEILTQGESLEGESQLNITDATGMTLTFDAIPERVICLFHECIELVSALGIDPVAMMAPDWLPNFADDPAYFPQPNNIVKLNYQESGSWDYEEIASLQPDIVFGSDEDRTALEGITQVYSVGNSYSMSSQDTLDHLLDYARIFDREAEAQAQIERLRNRLAAYKALAPRDQSVLLVAYWDEGAWIYSGISVPCSILNEVTVCDWENPFPEPGSWGYSSTVEAVLALDPDVIILENWTELPTPDALEQLRNDPLWSALRAVQNNRIFPQENRDAYGLGPIGGMRLLDLYMPLIYPDIFPDGPLTDEQVQEILAEGE